MVFTSLSLQESRHSKMEKADILELAVDYLKTTQVNNIKCSSQVNDNTSIAKYHTGFQACAEEVGRYFSKVQGVNPVLTNRLTNHLSSCLPMRQPTSFPVNTRPVEVIQQQQHSLPESTPVSSLPGTSVSGINGANSGPQTALPLYITTTGQMYGLHVLSPLGNTLTVCPTSGPNELGVLSPSPLPVSPSPSFDSHSPSSNVERRETPATESHRRDILNSKESFESMWRPWWCAVLNSLQMMNM